MLHALHDIGPWNPDHCDSALLVEALDQSKRASSAGSIYYNVIPSHWCSDTGDCYMAHASCLTTVPDFISRNVSGQTDGF